MGGAIAPDAPIVFEQAEAEDWQPTKNPLNFNPDWTYERYLFELARRDPNYVAEHYDFENDTWYMLNPFHVESNHIYSPLTRTDDTNLFGQIYNFFSDMVHPTMEFENFNDLVRATMYVPQEERQLFEYRQSEFRYMNKQMQKAAEELLDALPEGNDTMIQMALVELTKVAAVTSHTLFRNHVFRNVRNIQALTRAARQGATLEQLEEATESLLRNPYAVVRTEATADELALQQERLARQFLRETNRPLEGNNFWDAEVLDENQLALNSEFSKWQARNDWKNWMRKNPDALQMDYREAAKLYDPSERRFDFEEQWNADRDEILRERADLQADRQTLREQFEMPGEVRNNQIANNETTQVRQGTTQNTTTPELEAPPAEAQVRPAVRIRTTTDPEFENYLNDYVLQHDIQVSPNATVQETVDAIVEDGTRLGRDVTEFREMQTTMSEFRKMNIADIADFNLRATQGAELARAELLTQLEGEMFAGMQALTPMGMYTWTARTDEEKMRDYNKQKAESDFYKRVQNNKTAWTDQEVYVNIGGYWYRGTVQKTTFMTLENNLEVASVRLTDIDKTIAVPLNPQYIRHQDDPDFEPPVVAHWEPYTDPTQVETTRTYYLHNLIGSQILLDGRWRTLAQVNHFDQGTEEVELVFDNGDRIWVNDQKEWQYRHWGTDNTGAPVGQETQPLVRDRDAIVPNTEPAFADKENVMSYLRREHNEVYTIWKNPKYANYDENRVERIFGGVVPFLTYNSSGHPILVNDQELDHHGHTEFNMVSTRQGDVVAQQDFQNLAPMDNTGHFTFGPPPPKNTTVQDLPPNK